MGRASLGKQLIPQCVNHEENAAAYDCPICETAFCGECVDLEQTPDDQIAVCRACGGHCWPLGVDTSDRRTFFGRIPGALRYPLGGAGPFLIVGGAVYFTIWDWLFPRPGWAYVLQLIAAIFIAALLINVVATTADYDDERPGWPEILGAFFDAFLAPLGRLIFLIICCFAPAYLAAWFLGTLPTTALFILGGCYFPMGLLRIAVTRSFTSIGPLPVARAIRWAIFPYLFTCALFLACAAIAIVIGRGFGNDTIGFALQVLGHGAFFYATLVTMRVLGLLYLTNSDVLDW